MQTDSKPMTPHPPVDVAALRTLERRLRMLGWDGLKPIDRLTLRNYLPALVDAYALTAQLAGMRERIADLEARVSGRKFQLSRWEVDTQKLLRDLLALLDAKEPTT